MFADTSPKVWEIYDWEFPGGPVLSTQYSHCQAWDPPLVPEVTWWAPPPPKKEREIYDNQFWSTSNFLKPPNRTIRAWLSDFSCIYTHNHHAEKRHRHSQLHQRNTEKAGRFKTTIISEIITFLFSWKDRAAWRTPSSCKSQKMTGESTVQAAEIQKQSENLQAGFNFRKYINVISTGGA